MREHISDEDWKTERRDSKGNFIGLSYDDVFNMPRPVYERITRSKLNAQQDAESKRKDGRFTFKTFADKSGKALPAQRGRTIEGEER